MWRKNISASASSPLNVTNVVTSFYDISRGTHRNWNKFTRMMRFALQRELPVLSPRKCGNKFFSYKSTVYGVCRVIQIFGLFRPSMKKDVILASTVVELLFEYVQSGFHVIHFTCNHTLNGAWHFINMILISTKTHVILYPSIYYPNENVRKR